VHLLRMIADTLLARTPWEIRRRPRAPIPEPTFEQDAAAMAAAERVRARTMVAPAALVTLYRLVAHCEREGIEGALVQCGVWKGGSAAVMAMGSLEAGGGGRDLHLFDSFAGIPEPDARLDGDKAVREVGGAGNAQGRLRVANDYRERGGPGSPEEVRAWIESLGWAQERLHLHPGWFQETVPAVAPSIERIAVLHLDGDWYDSTRVCLEALRHRVVPGGFVVIDDYGCYEGCRRAVDEQLRALRPRPYLHFVNVDVRYWVA
jgi:O-methyltransferase